MLDNNTNALFNYSYKKIVKARTFAVLNDVLSLVFL